MSLFGINRNCNSRSAAKMIHMQVPTWQGKENAFTERKRKLGGLRVNTLEKGKAIHSNILAWRIPWTVLVHGVTKSQTQVSDFDFHAVNKELVAFRGLNCCGEEEPAFLLCCAPLCSTLCSPPGSSLSSFKSSKMMLWKCCAQNGPGNLENSAVARGLEKVSFHSNPEKGNTKECSNYHPIALISHASKEMLKILQARLQQYMDCELPDVQAGFSKGRGTRDQIANITWIIKKATEFQKNIYFCFIDYAKAFDCVDHNKLWKIMKQMGIPDYLTCLLRNLYAGQEATVRTGHGKTGCK